MEQLGAELEVQQANLEMIMQTNPGVIEQYERRKEEVRSIHFRSPQKHIQTHAQIAKVTRILNDREKTSQRLEREIKSARVREG